MLNSNNSIGVIFDKNTGSDNYEDLINAFVEKNYKSHNPYEIYVSGKFSPLYKEDVEANFNQADEFLRKKISS